MNIKIGYGTGVQEVEIDDKCLLAKLIPNDVVITSTEEEIIEEALNHPIGTERLEKLARGKQDIVIITSDITRPMPSYKVLPHVLKRLELAEVKPEQITIVFALGSHRKQTEEEQIRLVGEEIFNKYHCVDSSEFKMVHMGDTKENTPVDIAEKVAEADFRICLGNIEFHFFAGYSGGAKAIMPGVSNRRAIRQNHRKMASPLSRAGNLDTNPVRADLEEAARICGVDFILNVVLDEHKKVIYSVAGDLQKAHRKGCLFLDKFYLKEINQLADIVIVSQGGAPKDLNLYQTQKALANAEHAVRLGGIIILAGACPEGPGEAIFESWMLEAETIDQILERIQADFQIGGHKAASFARAMKRADIYLVSQIDPELVKRMFMTPFSSIQEAYDAAKKVKGELAKVIVMPYGGSTLPVLKEGGEG